MVEAAQQENRNLELSARNIEGVEMVRGNDGSSLSPAALRARDLLASRTEQTAGLAAKVCIATGARSGAKEDCRKKRKAEVA